MRQVLLYGGGKPGQTFTTRDGSAYAIADDGAFVRTNKDRRTKKERVRDRKLKRRAGELR